MTENKKSEMSIETKIDIIANKDGFLTIPRRKKEASQILSAMENMSIWEARELLGECSRVLDFLTINYSV